MTGSKLKIDIRRRTILEQLRIEGKVSVTALSEQLQVTPVTIRNDLAGLEKDVQLRGRSDTEVAFVTAYRALQGLLA